MAGTLSTNEEAQLLQTIEMFEVITQSQPLDYQSLEILKEAYFKLHRMEEVVQTSRRIAQAYVQLGQLSSAILEYEGILQQSPDDPEVKEALAEIEKRANSLPARSARKPEDLPSLASPNGEPHPAARHSTTAAHGDDGRQMFWKIYVEEKLISAADFDKCWPSGEAPLEGGANKPFIQTLADTGLMPLEKSLRILCERARLSFLPLEKYEIDIELALTFPREVCRRWMLLPFDRMSKSVLAATCNPFNREAGRALEIATNYRVVWYVSSPADLTKAISKIYR